MAAHVRVHPPPLYAHGLIAPDNDGFREDPVSTREAIIKKCPVTYSEERGCQIVIGIPVLRRKNNIDQNNSDFKIVGDKIFILISGFIY